MILLIALKLAFYIIFVAICVL